MIIINRKKIIKLGVLFIIIVVLWISPVAIRHFSKKKEKQDNINKEVENEKGNKHDEKIQSQDTFAQGQKMYIIANQIKTTKIVEKPNKVENEKGNDEKIQTQDTFASDNKMHIEVSQYWWGNPLEYHYKI